MNEWITFKNGHTVWPSVWIYLLFYFVFFLTNTCYPIKLILTTFSIVPMYLYPFWFTLENVTYFYRLPMLFTHMSHLCLSNMEKSSESVMVDLKKDSHSNPLVQFQPNSMNEKQSSKSQKQLSIDTQTHTKHLNSGWNHVMSWKCFFLSFSLKLRHSEVFGGWVWYFLVNHRKNKEKKEAS